MVKRILFALFFILVAILLQSTLLFRLSIQYAVPDIALLILVYVSYVNGRMTGQLTGFIGGLLQDFISLSPLGLNMFMRALIGYIAGMLKGAFFLDAVFLPMALSAGATLLKAAVLFALNILFEGTIPASRFDAPVFWIELGLNTVLAPFLFALLKLFGDLLTTERWERGRTH